MSTSDDGAMKLLVLILVVCLIYDGGAPCYAWTYSG